MTVRAVIATLLFGVLLLAGAPSADAAQPIAPTDDGSILEAPDVDGPCGACADSPLCAACLPAADPMPALLPTAQAHNQYPLLTWRGRLLAPEPHPPRS